MENKKTVVKINKESFLNNFIKWTSILIILGTISFLIMTYMKSTGFSFFDKWTNSSSNSIFGGSSKAGAGALQKSTMQVILAFVGGGALGLAGALLQKVTKNRLAEVSILGIGSLNILFIYIYATSLKEKAFGNTVWAALMPVFLIFVSIIGTLFVWMVSRSKKANKNTFVIVGIAMQLLVEALSVIIVNPTKLTKSSGSGGHSSEGKIIWGKIKGYTLGDIRNDIGNDKANATPWWLILLVIALVLVVFVTIFFIRRKIDTYETSEELAISTGINVKRLRLVIYLLVAVLAGGASAILGTVALLGIIAPSIARMLFKNRMWQMALASFFIGGIMVAAASFVSLNLELGLPVGILSTAIVIPYFIFLMVKEK